MRRDWILAGLLATSVSCVLGAMKVLTRGKQERGCWKPYEEHMATSTMSNPGLATWPDTITYCGYEYIRLPVGTDDCDLVLVPRDSPVLVNMLCSSAEATD